MSDRLKGKVAIVTGAGSRGPGLGNGKAACILFAREGARVLCAEGLLDTQEDEWDRVM
ncbi:MAG: 3-oxoacyl-ACP reductase, partial [candidate division NC10 bacterium]